MQTASVLHSDGDAYEVAVQDGRMVGVRGMATDRVNRGRLGPKDLFGWQANASPDRLTTPVVRRDGKLRPASWDEAMGAIVDRSKGLLEEQGPSALGFYTTGQLFIEDYYRLAVRPTTTSCTRTRSRSSATTSPRRSPSCGCACSTASRVPIRRGCWSWTRG